MWIHRVIVGGYIHKRGVKSATDGHFFGNAPMHFGGLVSLMYGLTIRTEHCQLFFFARLLLAAVLNQGDSPPGSCKAHAMARALRALLCLCVGLGLGTKGEAMAEMDQEWLMVVRGGQWQSMVLSGGWWLIIMANCQWWLL